MTTTRSSPSGRRSITGYLEAFNRDNVHLVNIKKAEPIVG
jgi:hypothetical protein